MYGKTPYSNSIKAQDTNLFINSAMYLVLGRQCEIGIADDRELYLSFRKVSGDLFYDFFKNRNEFSTEQLALFRDAVVALGDPSNKDPLHIVLNIAHKSILGRVFPAGKMAKEQNYIKEFFQSSICNQVVNALLSYATALLGVVGDTIVTSYGNNINPRRSRVKDVFVSLSQREKFAELIDLLAKVPQPLLPSVNPDEELSLPEIKSIKPRPIDLSIESDQFEINEQNRVDLRKLIDNCKGLLGFFYRSDTGDNIKFARYLLNCGDKISESRFNTVKQRYPHWDSGLGNQMVEIIAAIKQQKVNNTPKTSSYNE